MEMLMSKSPKRTKTKDKVKIKSTSKTVLCTNFPLYTSTDDIALLLCEFGEISEISVLAVNSEFDTLQANITFKSGRAAAAAIQESDRLNGLRFLDSTVYVRRARK